MKILITRVVGPDRDEPRAAPAPRRPRGLRHRQASQHVDRRVPGPPPGPRGPLRAVPRRDQRRRVPGDRPRRPPGCPRKVHQLVGEPHRALENAVMTFNVLEYARQANIPIVFSSSREVYGDVHRFEGYNEQAADFAYTEHVLRVEDRGRGVHLLVRALLRAPLPRLSVLERLRALRQRPPPHGPGHPALHPLDAARRAHHDLRGRDKTLDFTYVDDCVDGIARGIEALAERRVVNQTINLAYGRATRSCTAPSGSRTSSGPSRT